MMLGGGVVELDAMGNPTPYQGSASLPFPTPAAAPAEPRLDEEDKACLASFCSLVKYAKISDKGSDPVATERVLQGHDPSTSLPKFNWMTLSRWMELLGKSSEDLAQLIRSQLVTQYNEESRACKSAPWGPRFDPLPLSGFGYNGLPQMGSRAMWEALEAKVVKGGRTTTEHPVVSVVRCFIDTVVEQHRCSHKFEFPRDTAGGGYISLEAIAPWIKQHQVGHPLFTPKEGSSSCQEDSQVRLQVFQALLLFFSNVLNFDQRWSRYRLCAEKAVSEERMVIMAAVSGGARGEALEGAGDRGGGGAAEDHHLAATGATSRQWDPLAARSASLSLRGGMMLMPTTRVRLQQVELPCTPEQASSFNHMKQLFFVGLNTVFVDSSSSPDHSMHQVLSLLCHVAEERSLWGPFLLVAPRAHLVKWEDAAAFICPGLRVMSYYGSEQDRSTLRSFWPSSSDDGSTSSKDQQQHLYTPRAPFHIVLTHYEALVKDREHFQASALHWQYLVADDALGLLVDPKYKDVARCLLDIRCRRRLLVTKSLRPTSTSTSCQRRCPITPLLQFLLPTVYCVLQQQQQNRDGEERLVPEKGEAAKAIRCLVYRLTTVYTGKGTLAAAAADDDVDRFEACLGPTSSLSDGRGTKKGSDEEEEKEGGEEEWLSPAMQEELQGLDLQQGATNSTASRRWSWVEKQWQDVQDQGSFFFSSRARHHHDPACINGVPSAPPQEEEEEEGTDGMKVDGEEEDKAAAAGSSGGVAAIYYQSPWLVPAGGEGGSSSAPSECSCGAGGGGKGGSIKSEHGSGGLTTCGLTRCRRDGESQLLMTMKQQKGVDGGLLQVKMKEFMEDSDEEEDEEDEEDDKANTTKVVSGIGKLVGAGFESVLVRPKTVLGRLNRMGQYLGAHLGVDVRRGRPFMMADVNIGDSPAIATEHARIHWNGHSKGFEVLCLSDRGMLVNDVLVTPRMGAVPLPSRSTLVIADQPLCFLAPVPGTPAAGVRKLPSQGLAKSRVVSLLLSLLDDVLSPKVSQWFSNYHHHHHHNAQQQYHHYHQHHQQQSQKRPRPSSRGSDDGGGRGGAGNNKGPAGSSGSTSGGSSSKSRKTTDVIHQPSHQTLQQQQRLLAAAAMQQQQHYYAVAHTHGSASPTMIYSAAAAAAAAGGGGGSRPATSVMPVPIMPSPRASAAATTTTTTSAAAPTSSTGSTTSSAPPSPSAAMKQQPFATTANPSAAAAAAASLLVGNTGAAAYLTPEQQQALLQQQMAAMANHHHHGTTPFSPLVVSPTAAAAAAAAGHPSSANGAAARPPALDTSSSNVMMMMLSADLDMRQQQQLAAMRNMAAFQQQQQQQQALALQQQHATAVGGLMYCPPAAAGGAGSVPPSATSSPMASSAAQQQQQMAAVMAAAAAAQYNGTSGSSNLAAWKDLIALQASPLNAATLAAQQAMLPAQYHAALPTSSSAGVVLPPTTGSGGKGAAAMSPLLPTTTTTPSMVASSPVTLPPRIPNFLNHSYAGTAMASSSSPHGTSITTTGDNSNKTAAAPPSTGGAGGADTAAASSSSLPPQATTAAAAGGGEPAREAMNTIMSE